MSFNVSYFARKISYPRISWKKKISRSLQENIELLFVLDLTDIISDRKVTV